MVKLFIQNALFFAMNDACVSIHAKHFVPIVFDKKTTYVQYFIKTTFYLRMESCLLLYSTSFLSFFFFLLCVSGLFRLYICLCTTCASLVLADSRSPGTGVTAVVNCRVGAGN